jgi:hypothetical protein
LSFIAVAAGDCLPLADFPNRLAGNLGEKHSSLSSGKADTLSEDEG